MSVFQKYVFIGEVYRPTMVTRVKSAGKMHISYSIHLAIEGIIELKKNIIKANPSQVSYS